MPKIWTNYQIFKLSALIEFGCLKSFFFFYKQRVDNICKCLHKIPTCCCLSVCQVVWVYVVLKIRCVWQCLYHQSTKTAALGNLMCRIYYPSWISGLDKSGKSRSISFWACLVTLVDDGIRLETYGNNKSEQFIFIKPGITWICHDHWS